MKPHCETCRFRDDDQCVLGDKGQAACLTSGLEHWKPESLCTTCDKEQCLSRGMVSVCHNYRPFTGPNIGRGPFETQVGGNHYQDKFPFCQPSEFFARNQIPFMEGNVCKYALRHDMKNGMEDLRKAKHYLEMIAHCQYGEKL